MADEEDSGILLPSEPSDLELLETSPDGRYVRVTPS